MHQPTETTPYYHHPNPPTAPPADYSPSPPNYHLTPTSNSSPYSFNQYHQTQSLNATYDPYSSQPGQTPAPYSSPPVPVVYDSIGGYGDHSYGPGHNSAPNSGPVVSGGYGDQGGNYSSSVAPGSVSYAPGHNSDPKSGPGVSSYDNLNEGYSGYGGQGSNSAPKTGLGVSVYDHLNESTRGYSGYADQGSYSSGSYAPVSNSDPKSGVGVSSYGHLNENNGGYSGYGHQGGNFSSTVSSGSYAPGHKSALYSAAPSVPFYDSNGGYGDQGGSFSSSVSSGAYSSGSYATGHNSSPYSTPAVPGYDNSGYGDQGVYKYSGGKTKDVGYGGGKGREESSGSVLFDDYGRPISGFNGTEQSGGRSSPKIVKAVPKVEEHTDVKSGVQKYRVKILSEGYGQPDMDVLCQIGLDGIRILEPSTGRMLKIYPLETVTRMEVLDSYIFAFWAKTSIDAEPRRIRLKSNSYTTNNILDTVTAATIQVKEIGASTPSVSAKEAEQPSEKKKGLTDWVNFIKPGNEEKDHWVPDEAVAKCTACGGVFNAFNRRHHCRNCGDVFCDKCTQGRIALTADEDAQPVRVCDQCMAEVTQRLSNRKEAAVRVTGLQSHEDLAKKLQEVMNINRKKSSGSVSGGSRTQMRDVACPTCTVHLQVQVPATGSETIECSVCQQPFLVSAH